MSLVVRLFFFLWGTPTPQYPAAVHYSLFIAVNTSFPSLFCCTHQEIFSNNELSCPFIQNQLLPTLVNNNKELEEYGQSNTPI